MLLRTRVLQLLVLLERKSQKRFKGFIRKICYSLWMKLPALTRSSLRLERVACLLKERKHYSPVTPQGRVVTFTMPSTACVSGGLLGPLNVLTRPKPQKSTSNKWPTNGVRIPTCTTCGCWVNSPKTMTMQ